MRDNTNTRWFRSPIAVAMVLFVLAGAGSAMAALGPSTFVSNGDDGAATVRSAQPIGTLSETQDATDVGDETQSKGETEAGGGPTGEDEGAGDLPGTTTVVPASDANLPFTGYLAIPVLIAGMALLVTGAFVRRRATRPSAA